MITEKWQPASTTRKVLVQAIQIILLKFQIPNIQILVTFLSYYVLWKALKGIKLFLLWSQTDQSMTASVFGPHPLQITMGPRAPTVNLDQSGHAVRVASASDEEGRGMTVPVICTTL